LNYHQTFPFFGPPCICYTKTKLKTSLSLEIMN